MSDDEKEEVLDLEVTDAAEEKPEEEPEEAPKQGLKDKLKEHKIVVIAAVFLLIVVGVVAGLYFTGKFTAKKPHVMSMSLPGASVYQEIPKITVDLKPSTGHPRPFIRVVMQIQLEDEAAQTLFIERETQILDGIQSHLRTLTVDELHDAQGTERLKLDILMITRNVIKPHGAMAIFFKEFMIR